MRRLCSILMALLLPGTIAEATDNAVQQQDKRGEISREKKELGVTSATYTQLSGSIDRWVEANLAGDQQRARVLETSILNQLGADVTATHRRIKQSQAGSAGPAARDAEDRPSPRTGVREGEGAAGGDSTLEQAAQLLRVKERLASAIARSQAFSNKYRLLGDYLEVLRREMGLRRIELVEDVNEHRQDRVER